MMPWLRLRFGTPTVEDVAARLRRHLGEAGATTVVFDRDAASLRFEWQGGQMQTSLHHLHNDLVNTRRAERAGVLARFVRGVMLQTGEAMPAGYAQARDRLVPLLRTRADIALNQLMLTGAAEGAAAESRVASRPFVGDFVLALGVDTPQSTQRVNEDQLTRWDVGFDTAWEDAVQNLRGMPEHGGWEQVSPGLWRGAWGDSYESSRLLLPDLVYRLGVARPVAMVPLRHALLVADAQDEAALAAMVATTRALMEAHTRWLSFRPLRLVDRNWVPFTPPAALATAFGELAAIEDTENYAAQKRKLEALHQQAGTDLFVATAQLVRKNDTGQVYSYSVWTEGVDTLLPQTDVVALLGQDEDSKPQFASWAEVVRVAGHRFETLDAYPPRHRVRSFPSDEERAAMAPTD